MEDLSMLVFVLLTGLPFLSLRSPSSYSPDPHQCSHLFAGTFLYQQYPVQHSQKLLFCSFPSCGWFS